MEAPQGSQRSMQRRNPNSLDQSPSGGSLQSSGSGGRTGSRDSSGSTKSQSYKRSNPSQQLSQIEKSVTHLLVATKQLLETLTQWSRHNATEGEVSDVYVRLGYEFNIASRAFNTIGVDTADLGNVPDLLRSILEDTLSQEASPASLDRYLPRIRDIIINLLHGLKRKQQKLRQRQSKEEDTSTAGPSARQASLESAASAETSTTLVEDLGDGVGNVGPSGESMVRGGSGGSKLPEKPGYSPRYPSIHGGKGSPVNQDGTEAPRLKDRPLLVEREGYQSQQPLRNSSVSLSDKPMQGLPVVPSYSVEAPSDQAEQQGKPSGHALGPPVTPAKQHDALAALQRGGDLERRASRRYSAYQISKHLGASPNGMPMLPPAQNSPIPNRGRDARESMNAVRSRGSLLQSRPRPGNRINTDNSPSRPSNLTNHVPDRGSKDDLGSSSQPSEDVTAIDSPTVKTPEDKLGNAFNVGVKRPLSGESHSLSGSVEGDAPIKRSSYRDNTARRHTPTESYLTGTTGGTDIRQFIPEQSPQPGKELTLFLQYRSKIKKFVLPDGYNDLTIARLQLAFIEKFAWSTHNNGNDLPEIYIQDPVSGVRHELEDLADVKDRSVLVLNVEALDEVKRHIDDSIGGLKKMVEGVRTVVDSQQAAIQRVSDRQTDAAKDMARMAVAPASASNRTSQIDQPLTHSAKGPESSLNKIGQLDEIQSLRRDLAVLRQTYSGFVSDVEGSMVEVRAKASSVKSIAIDAVIPTLDGETGRSYVNKGKKELEEVSEALVTRVDDLQDIVEDLRKDVVTRGVRPLPRQLQNVGKDISTATAELKKIQEFFRREKPKWSKIWERELQVVCDDQDDLRMQEALATDLQDDLESAAKTFALVEEATKEQMKDGPGSTTQRSTSKGLNTIAVDPTVDPHRAKEGVLGEVRALQPNHENRLEAIERAEKNRQKELESRRGGEFQKELGSFVEEGRLKKSGGVEEAERLRKAKDERIRKEVWERQNARAKSKDGAVETNTSSAPLPETLQSATFDPTRQQDGPDRSNGQSDDAVATGMNGVAHGGDETLDGEKDGGPHRSSSSWLPSIFGS